MGLRLKLGINVIVFVSAVLAVMGYYWQRSERHIYLREMENRGIVLLRAFSVPCATAIANNDMPSLDNFVVQFAQASHVMDLRYLVVLNYAGHVLAHTTADEFGKIYQDDFTKRAINSDEPVTLIAKNNGELLLEIAVPIASGLRWGTLRAGFTLGSVEQVIERGRQRLFTMGIAMAIGAVAIAYWALSGLVIRPVMRMRNMARRFGSGELNVRVALNHRDEMGQLALALNSMAQQIQNYAQSLERLVAERTSELASANYKLVEANEHLERLATTDALTGLFNRRYFMEQLEFEVQRGQRSGSLEFALLLIDIDFFKLYNDTHGHPKGDSLLQHFSGLLQQNLRGTDVVARYGGEEFIILLFDTDIQKGVVTALKLQQILAAEHFAFEETQPLEKLTVSMGLSFYPHDATDSRRLIDYADKALYRSKQQGRNRVTIWREVERAS